jgi:hypothetical protein
MANTPLRRTRKRMIRSSTERDIEFESLEFNLNPIIRMENRVK